MAAAEPDDEIEAVPRLEGFHYWFGEFARLGLTSPQAEVLADKHGVDRHAVRESLIAARAKGDDPDFVFDTYS